MQSATSIIGGQRTHTAHKKESEQTNPVQSINDKLPHFKCFQCRGACLVVDASHTPCLFSINSADGPQYVHHVDRTSTIAAFVIHNAKFNCAPTCSMPRWEYTSSRQTGV